MSFFGFAFGNIQIGFWQKPLHTTTLFAPFERAALKSVV
jgi:hypothetical protein